MVFRTHDNKYAKMEIIYFYDSLNPDPSNGDYGGFYTFNYVYQSDGGLTVLKGEMLAKRKAPNWTLFLFL